MQGRRITASALLVALVFCLLLGNIGALAASETMDVSIPVSCTGAPCTAVLLDGAGNELARLNLTEGVTSYFTVHCAGLGDHGFQIKLINTDTATVTYDKTVFDVSITLFYGDDGQVHYVMSANPGNKPTEIIFHNTPKTTPPPCTDDPPVVKHVQGNPKKAETFTFVLTPDDPSYPMPAGSVNGVKTTTITGEGMSEFGIIEFTAPGRYTYTVIEKNGGAAGYTYDDSIYTIAYDVTEQNGALSVVRTILKDGKIVTGFNVVSFTNVYKEDPPPDTPPTPPDKPNPPTPKTGDDSKLSLWETAAGASLGMILLFGAVLIVTIKKGKKEEPNG